ncbi:MAG: hypothetical protein EXS17_03325 [Phycisphaerales bacterium]|nr:hypothetical protein [Phycisphaerales bacterium]
MRWESVATSTDAIVAIASPPGCAARGIVRVSGDASFAIVQERLAHTTLRTTRGVQSVRLRVCVAHVEVEVAALALVMVGRASFVGQDTVEFLIAGNPAILTAVVAALCDRKRGAHWARRATAGEFSARAFLNGRLAIDEAEAIALSISAESNAQLAAARQLRTGRVGQVAATAAQELTGVLALVEAGIDFSDQEDVVAITAIDLVTTLDVLAQTLAALLDGTTPEESLQALPVIALRGATNAGKSSLFNALLGRQRVVASEQAGSTRDAIVEPLLLHRGREVLLMDLPGIEEPQHALAEQMQELARHAFQSATLQLHCVPVTAQAHPENGPRMITIWTKADRADAAQRAAAMAQGGSVTSAITGEGIDELRESLTLQIDAGGWIGGARDAPVLLARHRAALADAHSAMQRARSAAHRCVEAGRRGAEPAELIATDLREALDALGIVAGHRTADDVLGALFARFCIGK